MTRLRVCYDACTMAEIEFLTRVSYISNGNTSTLHSNC